MKPLSPMALHALIVAAALPGSDKPHPGDAIYYSFVGLDELEMEDLDDDRKKLFWECATYLEFANTFGSAERASEVLLELEAVFPGFEFREPEPVSEPESEGEGDADD